MRVGRPLICLSVACTLATLDGTRGLNAHGWPDPPAWWTRSAMCVHRYESTDWHQHGYYSGGYQFLDSTWHAVGGHGRAGDATREEQTYRAWLLYQRVGWAAWPNTSRLCGLR